MVIDKVWLRVGNISTTRNIYWSSKTRNQGEINKSKYNHKKKNLIEHTKEEIEGKTTQANAIPSFNIKTLIEYPKKEIEKKTTKRHMAMKYNQA